ncbi:hypothetical protein Ae263Ps1_5818c [Pseudonocardia sp. Ae263_Ps1]|nr:hypothetical protein Ae263Ps1_5818c [Pseudonocardia sp. Ae263_Ps1]OLL91217.1 hypothetical protein Ae356Ps1_1114 [Pseudonocardia sp. Ae356_Ps1]
MDPCTLHGPAGSGCALMIVVVGWGSNLREQRRSWRRR